MPTLRSTLSSSRVAILSVVAGLLPAVSIRAAEPAAAPRPLLRMPAWLDSFKESESQPEPKPQPPAAIRPSAPKPLQPVQTTRPLASAFSTPAPGVRDGVVPASATAPVASNVIGELDDEPAVEAAVLPAVGDGTESAVDEPGSETGLVPVAGTATEQPSTVQPARGTVSSAPKPAAKPPTRQAPAKAAATAGNPVSRWFSGRMKPVPKTPGLRPAPATTASRPRPPAATRKPAAPPSPLAVDPEAGTPTAAKPAPVSAKVATPAAATSDKMPTLAIDAASFQGALPGKTSREELEKNWGAGEAFTRDDGTQAFFWKVEPFERVEITLENDVVASIRIKLATESAVDELARQLEISDLRTVSILDDTGVAIGQVYPERGVILSVKPGTQTATAILIEPLDPDSFVLRAEGEIETCSANAVADLLYAIELDPRHVRAHRLLLALVSDQGKWSQALQLAETAGRLDPADVWTQIKLASVLLALDRPADARRVLETVKSTEAVPPLVTAQVSRLLGRVALAGGMPDHQAAVEHFAEAIRAAAPLLAKRTPALEAATRELLLDAHLGTALAIAKGTWQQKSRVIPKWVARGEKLVAEFEGPDAEKMILELQLCRGALAAAAGSAEAIEPLPWVKRLLELRERMGDTVTDPWRKRQIDWETGQGLNDALAAAQKRGDSSDMLDNATLTAAYLERGGEHRELTAAEKRAFGDLLFRIGIMHSLQRGDHATAVTWFDRVVPLWEEGDTLANDPDPGRIGESYVSMAISYWQVERRDDALALSQRGVELMVSAVDQKQLDERALAVAYGNLATMYAEAGDDEQSRTYAEMASRAEATGTVVK